MGDVLGSDWLAPLRRHRRRREQGVPTLTVFTGPPGVAEWAWAHWQRGRNARIITVEKAAEVLPAWLDSPEVHSALRKALCARVTELERVSGSELVSLVAGRSPSQLEALVARVAGELDVPCEWVGWALNPPGVAPALWHEPARAVDRATRLLGSVPALLVCSAGSATYAREVAELLLSIVEQVPSTELAMTLNAEALGALRASLRQRLFATLTEGLVALQPRAGSARHAPNSGVPLEYDEEAFARSRQELALHGALERRSLTRGLFRLNGLLDSPDGALEVDLLCESLRLAVEIDGYHHFRDATAYRRDRRKDVRLQELGYIVVRVLASDVEKELEHVLEWIDRAVQERQGRVR